MPLRHNQHFIIIIPSFRHDRHRAVHSICYVIIYLYTYIYMCYTHRKGVAYV